jgi:hypothetical protein
VLYRQMPIGKVVSIKLSNDSNHVIMRLSIEPDYALLIRQKSVFYLKSGTQLKVGLKGVEFNADSLQSILSGAFHLAVPDNPGELVVAGTIFNLEEEKSEWKEWKSGIPLGTQLLPAKTIIPKVELLYCKRKGENFWNSDINKKTWVLTENKQMYLFKSFLDNLPEDLAVEFNGHNLHIESKNIKKVVSNEIDTLLSYPLLFAENSNNGIKLLKRKMSDAEDTIVFSENPRNAIAISKNNIQKVSAGLWQVQGSIPIHQESLGSVVISRVDGAIVGVLRVDNENIHIFPIIP